MLLPRWNGAYYSQNGGDLSLEFIFKDPINLTGFEIEGINDFILKNYEIIINDEDSVLYRTIKILNDFKMRDKPHISRHYFATIKCTKFKLVQKGPNWDRIQSNFIALRRIEFFTDKHPDGLIAYWNQNFDEIKTKKSAKEIDPHFFPIIVKSNHHRPDLIYDLNNNCCICTGNSDNEYCEVDFIDGALFMEGYRLKRKASIKMKGWKIVGTTLLNEEIVLSDIKDNDQELDLLYISEKDGINSSFVIKKIKIFRTLNNSDSSFFVIFNHFDVFGKYIPL